MSSRSTKVDAYIHDQAIQNNIIHGECRGEEKMKQYLEDWQNSFERHNRVNGQASERESAPHRTGNTVREVCGTSYDRS